VDGSSPVKLYVHSVAHVRCARRSGLPQLKVAKLTDAHLLDTARRDAAAVLADDRQLALPEHAALAAERLTSGPGDVN
jgi:hypothetical protein